MNPLLNIIPFLILFTLSIVISIMPYLTRNTVAFGISVSQEIYYSQPLRAMRRQYAGLSLAIHATLFLLYLLITGQTNSLQQEEAIGWMIPLMLLASYTVHLIYYRKMKSFKAALPDAMGASSGKLTIHTGFHKQKMNYSNKWFLIHGGIVLVSALLAIYYYDAFPEVIPMHYDFQGNVTRVADKSMLTVIGMNVVQLTLLFLFLFINWTIQRSKQQLHPDHPEESAAASAVFRRRWSLFIILSGLAIILLFSFIQLTLYTQLNPELLRAVSLVTVLLVCLGAVVLSLTTGQGGSKLLKTSPTSTPPINDDHAWKLGGIYYNPQDPSIFIEKRTGIGWTMNFARPMSWILLLGIIAIIASTSLLAR